MAKSRLSTRRVTSVQTYDPTDCTTVGWDVTLYSDGHLAAENWSCWQGSVTGERWVTAPERIILSEDSAGDDVDYAHDLMLRAVARLEEMLDSGWDVYSSRDFAIDGWTIFGWRSVRRGHVIK
jgi:hypothetical protein